MTAGNVFFASAILFSKIEVMQLLRTPRRLAEFKARVVALAGTPFKFVGDISLPPMGTMRFMASDVGEELGLKSMEKRNPYNKLTVISFPCSINTYSI